MLVREDTQPSVDWIKGKGKAGKETKEIKREYAAKRIKQVESMLAAAKLEQACKNHSPDKERGIEWQGK